jgi:hypothetical protein
MGNMKRVGIENGSTDMFSLYPSTAWITQNHCIGDDAQQVRLIQRNWLAGRDPATVPDHAPWLGSQALVRRGEPRRMDQ